jgi:hypothetical protein
LYNYLVYFVYFYTYFYIYWYIWYILCSFGIVVPVLVCCPKKNLATLLAATNEGDCKHGHFCRPVRDTFPKRKQKLWRSQKAIYVMRTLRLLENYSCVKYIILVYPLELRTRPFAYLRTMFLQGIIPYSIKRGAQGKGTALHL